MLGVPAEDPSCIHNIDELERRVEENGKSKERQPGTGDKARRGAEKI